MQAMGHIAIQCDILQSNSTDGTADYIINTGTYCNPMRTVETSMIGIQVYEHKKINNGSNIQ